MPGRSPRRPGVNCQRCQLSIERSSGHGRAADQRRWTVQAMSRYHNDAVTSTTYVLPSAGRTIAASAVAAMKTALKRTS